MAFPKALAIAELICFGEYHTIDVSALGVERIAANQLLFEKNIFQVI